MNFLCFLCLVLFGVTTGYPYRNGFNSAPSRAYMFGGYYSNPIFSRSREFIPQGAMSAVLTGDSIATNSFTGPHMVPEAQLPLEESESGDQNYPQQELGAQRPEDIEVDHQHGPELILDEEVSGVAVAEEASTESVVLHKPTKRTSRAKANRKPVKKNEDEEDEEEDAGAWPFAGARGGVPSYNAFFPITISGGSYPGRRTKSADDDEYVPSGSATAIANSFSTGKGGIATSHATSFGDPYLASMLFQNRFNVKSKKSDKED